MRKEFFFNSIYRHFSKTSIQYKIFDKNTIKISYSCIDNTCKIIQKLNHSNEMNDAYNCRRN